jgi:transcriptional regulator with XRE-family HTH domain
MFMKERGFIDERDVSKRIIEVRMAAGLSQGEFAEKLKMSRTHIGSIERNSRKIQNRMINLICLTFGVNEGWLRTGKGGMFDHPKNHKLEKVMVNFNQLDDLLQDFVLKEIDGLLEYMQKKKAD